MTNLTQDPSSLAHLRQFIQTDVNSQKQPGNSKWTWEGPHRHPKY